MSCGVDSSPQWVSSELSPQSLTPSQTTPRGPAGTQRPFSHWNSFSLQPPAGETGEGGLGDVNQREPGDESKACILESHTQTQHVRPASFPPTIATAHDLKAKIDAILEVMGREADKLSRHDPVQSALRHSSIIVITEKNLGGEQSLRKIIKPLK